MKELLFSVTRKDFNIDFFSGTGAGGQYRNKHQNCMRLRHTDSGTIVTGQSHRNQKANIKEALDNLVKHPKFLLWHHDQVNKILRGKEKTIDEIINELMAPENIKVEWFIDGEWVEENKC